MSPSPACNKETGICPYPLPMTRAVFDSIVKQQRDAITSTYTTEREAFIDDKFGSTREEREQDSAAQKEADIAHLTRFHSKYALPDPFAAPWLPPQCPVTVPRFPHNEMVMAKNGVKALEPAEGRHLREFVEAGHRLLAIPYEELVTIPFMDAWLFKYALTRFFDYEDGARRFLLFREAVLEHGLSFAITDEIRQYITVGAINPLPQHVEAVSKGLLLHELVPNDVEKTVDGAEDAVLGVPQTRPWSPRTPVSLLRPRILQWDKVPVEPYCRALSFYNMNAVGLDWVVQVQGMIMENSVKKVGLSAMNRKFHTFNSHMQRCLPAKFARGYIVNEGFFMHNIAYPLMKVIFSAKIMSKIRFVGKDYGAMLAELGPDRAMVECGGNIKLNDDGALALAFLEALHCEQ